MNCDQEKMIKEFTSTGSIVGTTKTPNKACTGQVGFAAIFEYFSLDSPPGQAGFEFFLLPSIVHTRPPASNANR